MCGVSYVLLIGGKQFKYMFALKFSFANLLKSLQGLHPKVDGRQLSSEEMLDNNNLLSKRIKDVSF